MTVTTPPPRRSTRHDDPFLPPGRHGRDRPRRKRIGLFLGLVAVVVLVAAVAAAGVLLRGPGGPADSGVAASPATSPPAAAGTDPANPTATAVPSASGVPDALALTARPTWDGDTLVVPAQVRTTVAASAVAVRITADGAARPAVAALGTAVSVPRRTAVLAVDTSGSMGASGIAAARAAALRYAAALGPDVEIGLVSFADTATVLTPPTADRTSLRTGLARLRSGGETALYDGLRLAVRTAGSDGNVVVLSDGGNTVGRSTLPQAVTAVRGAGVRLDAVAFRTAESNGAALAAVSTAGGGQVLRAAGTGELGRAFAAAATAVPVDLTIRTDLSGPAAPPTTLDAAVDLGGRTFTGQIAVPARPGDSAVGAAPAPAPAPAPAASPNGPLVLAAVAFLLLLGLILLAAWPRRARPTDRRDLALAVYDGHRPTGGPAAPNSALSSATAGVLDVTERALARNGRRAAVAERLDRAGLTLLPHEWVVLRSCIVLACTAVFMLLLTPRGLGLVLGPGLALGGTEVWLRWRQARRCSAFAEQLPDTLQVVASSLRSGFALPQALAATQENAQEPMASELGRALAAARIGVDLEDELERIAVRMRSEEWRLAVMAIRIQRSVGGSLAEVLSTTAHTLRERAALFRQARALSAEGRLSAYILLALPFAVGGFMLLFRTEYLRPLWTTLPGLVMVAGAVVGMVIGTLWMFKVATIEV